VIVRKGSAFALVATGLINFFPASATDWFADCTLVSDGLDQAIDSAAQGPQPGRVIVGGAGGTCHISTHSLDGPCCLPVQIKSASRQPG